MGLLNKTMPLEAKNDLLKLVNLEEDADGVIYDYEGNEFYADENNLKYRFDTLIGFLEYYEYYNQEIGANKIKRKFKKLMGLSV